MRQYEGKVRLQYIGKVNGIKAKNIKVGDTLMWNGGSTSVVKSIEFTKTGKSVKIVEIYKEGEFDRTMRSERLVAIAKFANNEEAEEIKEIQVNDNVIGSDMDNKIEGTVISKSDTHVLVKTQEGKRVFHVSDVKINEVEEVKEEEKIEEKAVITIEGESRRERIVSSDINKLQIEFTCRLCETQPKSDGLDRCYKTNVNIKYKNYETSIRLDLDSRYDILTNFEELVVSILEKRIEAYSDPDCILKADTIKEELKQNRGVLSYFKTL